MRFILAVERKKSSMYFYVGLGKIQTRDRGSGIFYRESVVVCQYVFELSLSWGGMWEFDPIIIGENAQNCLETTLWKLGIDTFHGAILGAQEIVINGCPTLKAQEIDR